RPECRRPPRQQPLRRDATLLRLRHAHLHGLVPGVGLPEHPYRSGGGRVLHRAPRRTGRPLDDLPGRRRALRRPSRPRSVGAPRPLPAWGRVCCSPSTPTGPEVVASYIAHRAELVAHSTISRDVAVISAAHLDKGLGDPTAHHGVRQALRSAGRALGTSPSRRATPLTTVLMRQIIDAMDDLETATGKRDRAILLLGLAAALRRRELAALTTNDIARQGAGLLLQIRRSKTDQTG